MAKPRSILEDLPFCLMRATGSFRRLSDTTLRALGLPPHPAGIGVVLHTLHEAGDCTVNFLVDSTHLPNGTLTGLLDTLERNGHVRRVPNARDGRSWLVRLTPRGRRFCAALDQRHQTVMRLFARTLAPAESAELSRLLNQLAAGMRAYVAAQEGTPRPRRPRRSSTRRSGSGTTSRRTTH